MGRGPGGPCSRRCEHGTQRQRAPFYLRLTPFANCTFDLVLIPQPLTQPGLISKLVAGRLDSRRQEATAKITQNLLAPPGDLLYTAVHVAKRATRSSQTKGLASPRRCSCARSHDRNAEPVGTPPAKPASRQARHLGANLQWRTLRPDSRPTAKTKTAWCFISPRRAFSS